MKPPEAVGLAIKVMLLLHANAEKYSKLLQQACLNVYTAIKNTNLAKAFGMKKLKKKRRVVVAGA